MQRKLKLNRMILGGLLLGSLSTFGVPLIRSNNVCPIGGEKFKDSHVPQCLTNKFVMFKNDFTEEELKKYEKIINSKEYREIPGNSNKYYYLARFYEILGGISDKEIGKTYFTSYHYYSENTEIKKEALQKGISYMEKADKKFWKSINLFYMDEPEMYLGNVYNEKKISTAKDLQQALVYADKILSDIEENNSEKINEMQKFQFENIKRQVKSKDKRVYQYFPPQVMY